MPTRKMVDIKNIGNNFWQLYPEYQYKRPFDTIHNPRKLKDSSKQAWYIVAMCQQSGNIFYNMPYEVRKQELIDTGLISEKLITTDVELAVEDYPKHMYSRPQRNLDIWGKKLDDLYTYIDESTWEDQGEELLKYMEKADKLWKMYANIVKEFDKEDSTEQIKGGGQLSALERGEI